MSTPAGVTFLLPVEKAPRALRALRRVLLRPKRVPGTVVDVAGVGAVELPYASEPDAAGRRVDRLEPGGTVRFDSLLPCRTAAGPRAPRHPFFASGDRGGWEERRRPGGVYTLLPTGVTLARGRDWFSIDVSDENDRGFALFRFPAASRLTWAFRRGGGAFAFCWSCGDACRFNPVELGEFLPPALSARQRRALAADGAAPYEIPDDPDAEGEPLDLGDDWWEERKPDDLARRLRSAGG